MAEIVTTLADHLKRSGADAALQKLVLSYAYTALDAQDQFPKYLRGTMGDRNKYGEVVAALDDWVNGFLCDSFIKTGVVRKIYSEELKTPLLGTPNAPFVVTLDPLDGSSNIATNNPIGSIVGIYRDDLPQSGRKLACAMYKLYGPVNTLVYSIGKGSHEFVKHYDSQGNAQFQLLYENMRVPEPGEVFGIGGAPLDWKPKFLKFAKDLFRKEKLKVRYSGTFVADFSQILHRGGLFSYPAAKKAPRGKLRLVYEGVPMAFIWEQANGVSWDGKVSLLDSKGLDVDARTPLYLGNRHLIEKLKKAVR